MSSAWFITQDPTRWLVALLVTLLWLSLWVPPRRARLRPGSSVRAGRGEPSRLLVCYASQSGNAEQLAHQAAERLQQVDARLQLLPLGKLTAAQLGSAERVVLIVSTYGEGEPPDSAGGFVSGVLGRSLPLDHLQFLLLGLGDRSYLHFCGFAQKLETWLMAKGAKPIAPSVYADRLDRASLNSWQQHLTALGASQADNDPLIPWHRWRLAGRECLNPHSSAAPAYLIRLEPLVDGLTWLPGDIAQIQPQHLQQGRAIYRDYSIASLAESGAIELLVRLVRRPDGHMGRVSGWLCQGAQIGDTLMVSVRNNAGFHAPTGHDPLILIGAGTGLAGLRAHLLNRVAQGRFANWLIFGERHPLHDHYLDDELDGLHARGRLARLDRCYSRSVAQPEYVQDRLAARATELREWVERGATIMVCGSLQGMGHSVDAQLRELLGEQAVQGLQVQGRYRRDLY